MRNIEVTLGGIVKILNFVLHRYLMVLLILSLRMILLVASLRLLMRSTHHYQRSLGGSHENVGSLRFKVGVGVQRISKILARIHRLVENLRVPCLLLLV